MGSRCINGELVRPTPSSDDSPSTACQASIVRARGGVRLGKANPPSFGSPPGIVPSRRIPPPGHLSIPNPRAQEEEQAREQVTRLIHPAMHTHKEEEQVPVAQEEESPQEETLLAAIQVVADPPPPPPPGSTPGHPGGTPPTTPPTAPPANRAIDPWANIDLSYHTSSVCCTSRMLQLL